MADDDILEGVYGKGYGNPWNLLKQPGASTEGFDPTVEAPTRLPGAEITNVHEHRGPEPYERPQGYGEKAGEDYLSPEGPGMFAADAIWKAAHLLHAGDVEGFKKHTAEVGAPLLAQLLGGVKAKLPADAVRGAPAVHTPPEVTGSKALGTLIPATVGGEPVENWGPEQFQRFGEHFGVGNLGHASPGVEVKLSDGRVVTIPRSLTEDGPTPSYWDTLALKSQGINPDKLPLELRNKIHDRMVEATDPGARPTNEHIYNGMLFGMSSPNNPLTPNQFAMVRAMAKSPEDIAKIAEMVPWDLDQAQHIKGKGTKKDSPETLRSLVSPQVPQMLGLQAGERGGLGVSGSADWTRIADMSKMFAEDPDFFRFPSQMPDTPANWEEHVGRIASQVPGTSFKTGSFGSVWQRPTRAMISAMDRHMASAFRDSLFDNPADQAGWEQGVVDKYNKQYGLIGKTKITSIDQMLEMPGGRGIYGDEALAVLGKHSRKLLRTKSGEINPDIPEYLQQMRWIRDPEKVMTMSDAYSRALAENARLALEGGRAVFPEQWRIWDAIRQRIEPHENMNPFLSRIGRMSLEQLMKARDVYSGLGYMESPAEVQPTGRPGTLAAFEDGGSPDDILKEHYSGGSADRESDSIEDKRGQQSPHSSYQAPTTGKGARPVEGWHPPSLWDNFMRNLERARRGTELKTYPSDPLLPGPRE